jgi:DUF4097 and DUF4098 domain-containing protein YvlB
MQLLLAGGLAVAPSLAAERERTLSLPSSQGGYLAIDAGAGFLKVAGREGQSTIEVQAQIVGRGFSGEDLDAFIKEKVVLTLEKTPRGAALKAEIKQRSWSSFMLGARIDLTVTVPKATHLSIDDGSGDMVVEDLQGNLTIDDGSGDIQVKNVTGDVKVDDGSGSMTLLHIGGSVTVEDGSGSILIDDVAKDVHLGNTGRGGLKVKNVKGQVYRR